MDRCCLWMKKNNQSFDMCYPANGDVLPSVDRYAGVISFGGACSANDEQTLDWIRLELDFIEQCLQKSTAFFGICLGAQLLARVLGAKVYKHPDELKEVGFHLVHPTGDSGSFLTMPKMMMQWHSEGFDLPEGSQLLATNSVFPNQAFSYSDGVYGVQFHPEVNPAALAVWHERNKKRDSGRLTEPERQAMMGDAERYDSDITQWLDAFLLDWSARAQSR